MTRGRMVLNVVGQHVHYVACAVQCYCSGVWGRLFSTATATATYKCSVRPGSTPPASCYLAMPGGQPTGGHPARVVLHELGGMYVTKNHMYGLTSAAGLPAMGPLGLATCETVLRFSLMQLWLVHFTSCLRHILYALLLTCHCCADCLQRMLSAGQLLGRGPRQMCDSAQHHVSP